MKYVRMPHKAKVDLGEMQEYNTVCALMSKHGYFISFFGASTITFYKMTDKDADWNVPIDSRYVLDRREFRAFLEVLRKLDDAEERAKKHLRDVVRLSSISSGRPSY